MPMAVWGGRPIRIRSGIVIRLLPPTSVPKVLQIVLAQKMMISCVRSIAYREYLSVSTGGFRGVPASKIIHLILMRYFFREET